MEKNKIHLKNKHCIIFDLDGTLYSFKGGKFQGSELQKKILSNARQYIGNRLHVSEEKAKEILGDVFRLYGEDISLGLEKEYGLDRYDYFETVWNIPARGLVSCWEGLRALLLRLKESCDLLVLSDAPKVWINNVLTELQVADLFESHIISGEGDNRKNNGRVFSSFLKSFGVMPEFCVLIGDQEETDIIPAKLTGFKTVLVSDKKVLSVADFCVKNISEIENVLKLFLN